jgi:hypothetical protein
MSQSQFGFELLLASLDCPDELREGSIRPFLRRRGILALPGRLTLDLRLTKRKRTLNNKHWGQ